MILLLAIALSAAGWAAVSFLRGNRAVAAGSATFSLVTALAWFFTESRVEAWIAGGWGMNALAIAGGYALGAAVAFRSSRSRGSLFAALSASVLTLALCGFFYWDATRVLPDVLRDADRATAELIFTAAHAEAVHLVQLGAALLLGALVLLIPRRPTPTLQPALFAVSVVPSRCP